MAVVSRGHRFESHRVQSLAFGVRALTVQHVDWEPLLAVGDVSKHSASHFVNVMGQSSFGNLGARIAKR